MVLLFIKITLNKLPEEGDPKRNEKQGEVPDLLCLQVLLVGTEGSRVQALVWGCHQSGEGDGR